MGKSIWAQQIHREEQAVLVGKVGKVSAMHGLELSTENQRSLGKAWSISGKTGHSQLPKLVINDPVRSLWGLPPGLLTIIETTIT